MAKPVLCHIPVSHYSEKARWALDFKEIDHDRRAIQPPSHMAAVLLVTRGRSKTLPLLRMNGEVTPDSTAVIAALERAFPEKPLYPPPGDARARSLALEEFFDEELGPHTRLLAFHEMTRDPEAIEAFAAATLPAAIQNVKVVRKVAGLGAAAFAKARFRVADEGSAEIAREKIAAAFDRVEQELAKGSGDYLVGDRFSVADLTAASLFAPLVAPPEGPPLPPPPAAYERFGRSLSDRPGYKWVEEVFGRHRQGARRP